LVGCATGNSGSGSAGSAAEVRRAGMQSNKAPLPVPDESLRLRAGSDYDEPPRVLRQTKPLYPSAAYRAKTQGQVVLSVALDETGRVGWWAVDESVPGLDEAAIRCVLEWEFAPAKRNGVAVPVLLKVPISYTRY
jgi:protein TonB